MQLSLVKFHKGTRWGKTLCQEGGTFECWKSHLLAEQPKSRLASSLEMQASESASEPASKPASAPSASLTKAGKPKPRFTLRDDGDIVEVDLPLPAELKGKQEVRVEATPTRLAVTAGLRSLLRVQPLFARTHADELTWTLQKGNDGQLHCQLQLAKVDESTTWTTLVEQGGEFTCWTAEL